MTVMQEERKITTLADKRRKAEAFAHELGAILQNVENFTARLAQTRASREIASKLNPEEVRGASEEAIKIARVVEALERVANDKARRDTIDRTQELFVDLRVRLEMSEKSYAAWRGASAKFEYDTDKSLLTAEERSEREKDLSQKKSEYESWAEMAYRMVPGTGITLL